MEKLGQLIHNKVTSKNWKPIKPGRRCRTLSHFFFADDLVLFGEATQQQAEVMWDCLNTFCGFSGQLVSIEKSKMMFSKNTYRSAIALIKSVTDIPCADTLGKYLGIPLNMGRISRLTTIETLEKVRSKLANWRANQLSLAGRFTLIQASSVPVPFYQMQVANIPSSICSEIDKLHRKFLWGSTDSQRKIHLVNWDTVCKPKAWGGLGIKPMGSMNQVLLAKLGWRVLKEQDQMWANIMLSKYLDNYIHSKFYPKQQCSQTWRGITKSADLLTKGAVWKIGNGQEVMFWTDKWLHSGPIIENIPVADRANIYLHDRVADYILADRWDVVKLNGVLSSALVEEIRRLSITHRPDNLIWAPTVEGQFSVVSSFQNNNLQDWIMQNLSCKKKRKGGPGCPLCHLLLEDLALEE